MWRFIMEQIVDSYLVDEFFNVKERIHLLAQWQHDYLEKDSQLQIRQKKLNPQNKLDKQVGFSIARMRRRIKIFKAPIPLEVESDMDGDRYFALRSSLHCQFANLTEEERLLWLNNFSFILPRDMKRLFQKINRVRSYRSLGQQRCFLVGGESGSGKTTCLDAFAAFNEPEITDTVSIVKVVKIDAPANNKGGRSLYRRIINSLGLSYTASDSEEELLETAIAFLDACQTELLIVDEIQHIKAPVLKRQLLELSNLTSGIPIICASCNPQEWTDGDEEISGRWNDYFSLENYTNDRLRALLLYLDTFLPFSKPSNLIDYKGFIEDKTRGVLRDIMMLIHDSCELAIKTHQPTVGIDTLNLAWRQIQERPNNRIDF